MSVVSPNPSVHSYYERYWTEAGYNPERDLALPSVRRLFEKHVDEAHVCLDVGCGDGGTAGLHLAKHARGYVGVDVSSEAVEKAKARGLDAHQVEDASRLPFSDSSFDVAVCIEVLEHLFDPRAAAVEILRVLRPGGKLIATVPNAAHWRDRLDMLVGQWKPRGDALGTAEPWRSPHIRFFSRRALERMLLQAGFSEVATGGHTDAPLLSHLPVARRLIRNTEPASPYRWLVRIAPSLVSPGLWAVAQNNDGRS